MIQKVKISEIKVNPENPRVIKDYKFKELVQSIKAFPEMLQVRPIVVNKKNVIIGGNQRYKAAVEAGLTDVYIIVAKDFSEKQEAEFLIKDNINGGEWDWTALKAWDNDSLFDWGLDAIVSNVAFAPTFEPTTSNYEVSKADIDKKTKELSEQMNQSVKMIDVICPNCTHEFKLTN
jgi:hypothetical protein